MAQHVADIILSQRSGNGSATHLPTGARPRLLLPVRAVLGGDQPIDHPSFSGELLWRDLHRSDRIERLAEIARRWFFLALIAAGLVLVGIAMGMIVDIPGAWEMSS